MVQSVGIILLAVSVYGVIHSILASFRVKELARRQFGAGADRLYRLLYNLFAIFSFLPVLGLVGLLPDQTLYRIPSPWVFLSLLGQGVAVLALGIGLLQTGVWTFLGVEQLFGMRGEDEDILVVRGLYRWVRHPLYTAGLLIIWLTPVMTANLLALNLGLTGYIVIGAWVEERKLQRVFGPAYAEYQETTPMLIPGLRFRR